MKRILLLAAILFLTGCSLVRHDSIVRGVFNAEPVGKAIDVDEEWAK